MREILLIGIVALICLVALVRPRLGLYGYTWFGLMRPDVLAWTYGEHPFSMAIAICLLLGMAGEMGSIGRLFRNPFSNGLILLTAIFIMSTLAAVDSGLSFPALNLFLRVVVISLLIPVLIRTYDHLREYLVVIAVSLGLLSVKFGLYAILHGGVYFAQGHGGFMGDNNMMALGFAMAAPLCWHLRGAYPWRWYKLAMLGMGATAIITVVMTHSRGAVLALGPAMLLAAWRSKVRIAAVAVVGIVCLVSLMMVGASFFERWDFIKTGELDLSANSRIEQIVGAFKMWKDHPLLGVGYGTLNWIALSSQYMGRANQHVVHNTYAQVLVDTGIFGFLLFTALLAGALLFLQSVARRARKANHFSSELASAIQLSMFVYVVGSLTHLRVQYDLYYILLMCVASLYLIVKEHGFVTSAEEQPAFEPVAATLAAPNVAPVVGWATQNSASAPLSQRKPAVGIATAAKNRLGERRLER